MNAPKYNWHVTFRHTNGDLNRLARSYDVPTAFGLASAVCKAFELFVSDLDGDRVTARDFNVDAHRTDRPI